MFHVHSACKRSGLSTTYCPYLKSNIYFLTMPTGSVLPYIYTISVVSVLDVFFCSSCLSIKYSEISFILIYSRNFNCLFRLCREVCFFCPLLNLNGLVARYMLLSASSRRTSQLLQKVTSGIKLFRIHCPIERLTLHSTSAFITLLLRKLFCFFIFI